MEIVRQGSQLFVNEFPVLGLPDEGRAVKYFSLNPFLPDQRNRCPLECAYCVCHQDSKWHRHPEQYSGAEPPENLLDTLLDHIFAAPEGQQGFPISLCDYSDPFIPAHQQRVISILEALIERDAANMVYITTKAHPGKRFLAQLADLLARPNALRVTVFVSLPPLQRGYEPVSIPRRVQLLKDLVALEIPCSWYLRPLVEEWYDDELMWRLTRELLPHVADHVILSGIVMSEEVEAELLQKGLFVPEWDQSQPGKKQNLRPEFEAKLRSILKSVAEEAGIPMGPIMSHRLCGTNGNHAYGCLLCGKQQRYCQLFQLHHYGDTVDSADNQQLKILLREKAAVVRARSQAIPLLPSADECRPLGEEIRLT